MRDRILCLAAACLPCGCDVQVRDLTAAQQPENGMGLYEVRAEVRPGALVNPNTVYLFALGERQRVALAPVGEGQLWTGLYSARCRSRLPLQLQAIWKLEGMVTRQRRIPPSPREIRLLPRPPARDTRVTTGGPGARMPKEGWPGAVTLLFRTAPRTHVTAAQLQPLSAAPADEAAARAIRVTDPLPLEARCEEPLALHLAASAANASARLLLSTDDPAVPRLTVRVDFESAR